MKTDNNNFKVYEVKKGDNITKVASQFSVTTSEILSANNLNKNSIIKPGDRLRIPVAVKKGKMKNTIRPSGRIVYYTIQKGHNLWRIANHFKVTVDSLYKANNLQKNEVLMPGKTIRVILPEGS